MHERGLFVTFDHETRGPVTIPGWPVLMSSSPNISTPAPSLGNYTSQALTGILGLADDDIAALRADGII